MVFELSVCLRVHCFYAIFLLEYTQSKAQLLKGKHIKKSWRTQWNFSVEITLTIQMLNECMLSLELGTCIHLNSKFLYQFDCLLSSWLVSFTPFTTWIVRLLEKYIHLEKIFLFFFSFFVVFLLREKMLTFALGHWK